MQKEWMVVMPADFLKTMRDFATKAFVAKGTFWHDPAVDQYCDAVDVELKSYEEDRRREERSRAQLEHNHH